MAVALGQALLVLLALGLKKVLEYVSDTEAHDLSDPLQGGALAALVLGVSSYLVGQVAFVTRCARIVKWHRLGVAVAILPLMVAGRELPAILTLAILAGAVVTMAGWETHRFAEERHRVRHAHHG